MEQVKQLIYLIPFVLVLVIAVAISIDHSNEEVSTEVANIEEKEQTIPQLEEEGRADAATMVLVDSPPMQPADHVDRWHPDLREQSCMSCHASEATGAPKPPENHYYEEEELRDKIFRDNCLQCHATQNDTKPAFNRED